MWNSIKVRSNKINKSYELVLIFIKIVRFYLFDE